MRFPLSRFSILSLHGVLIATSLLSAAARAQTAPAPDPSVPGGDVRPLSQVLDNREGMPFSLVQLEARDQAASLGPKHRNIPAFLPYYVSFEGQFIPAANTTRLAIFSDDGADVYLDGVLVLKGLGLGQHLPNLQQSLHPIDEELVAGHSYTVRVDYFNGWYYGTTDADGATLFAYTTDGNDTRPVGQWRAGNAISSGGIRWPSASMKIRAGTVGKLSAFLGTDFDQRDVMINGQTSTQVLSDPCSYSWSANAGTFPKGQSGQAIDWIAPTTPGLYTLVLVVDDQNVQNQPAYEAGTRGDAARSFNDEPQKFSVTVEVIP